MEIKNEKKVLVLSFLGVVTLIAVVVGATYAYFQAQGGGSGNINVNANTATTDNLSFHCHFYGFLFECLILFRLWIVTKTY